ncbi:MxaD family protein [Streptomyces pluripotens]|uniref:MxaD family protein n=1 Tax=Streptomyces pluripotens TaxID=1355015 RepID=A0A221P6X4_9ACTN|nr:MULTISPECIES: SRPBCC family protein [Streptomyces]ARP73496.1 MxaD family protein [Streptomyces pluripotens]ASN27748.1 MxaD family protein [Streptomyces pluripotens]KIE26850.1 polyketide cyclase [Streptomyces sp. MUSC 125]MCH0557341.1 SRPBCC family protein [Streptomyces sp. MUM 16J]
MAQRLRPVGLDFVETAPVRLSFVQDVAATPDAVHRALGEDVEGWSEWFSAVSSARPTEGGRAVRLRGGIRFEETVLVAKAPEVYAYRVDATNAPGARAWVEEWRLAPAGRGTRIQMTFALDGTAAFRLVCRLAKPGAGRAVRSAIAALDRRLARTDRRSTT